MFISFLKYLKNGLEHPITQIFFRFLSIFSLISTSLTLLGFLFYTVGYSFLYGYYFSGSISTGVSLIELLIKDIPFPWYSVIITSITFTIAVSVFIFILYSSNQSIKQLFTKGQRLLGVLRMFITIIGCMTFHFALTTFFVGGLPTFTDVFFDFSLIWIGPFLLAIFIYSFIQLMKGIYSALSGMLYGLIGIAIVGSLLEASYSAIFLIPLFVVTILFSFFEHLIKYVIYRFFLWLPIFFILFIVIMSVVPALKPANLTKLFISIFIAIIISALFAFFIGNKKKKVNNKVSKTETLEKNSKPKIVSMVTLLVIVLIAFLLTSIPLITEKTGVYFRELTPKKSRQTIIYNENQKIMNATLVAKKDSIYYISSTKWKLIVLKTENIRIHDDD